MTRTTAREIAIHLSYTLSFAHESADTLLANMLEQDAFARFAEETHIYADFPNEKQRRYISALVKGVSDHAPELDGYIAQYAIGWSFSRISRLASAIMRVAMYEILYMEDIPNSAAINEAVQIAKDYEEPKVVSFLNGILGAFVRAEFPETAPAPQKAAAVEPPVPQPAAAPAPECEEETP